MNYSELYTSETPQWSVSVLQASRYWVNDTLVLLLRSEQAFQYG